MEAIINAVFAEIANCSHREHRVSGTEDTTSFRVCIDSKVESLVLTGIHLVQTNPMKREENKREIRQIVRNAIQDCSDSLSEIGYDVSQWAAIENCIQHRGDRLVDMAVDLMTDQVVPEAGEIKKHRCSRRKKSSSKRRKRSPSRKVKSVVWKKK